MNTTKTYMTIDGESLQSQHYERNEANAHSLHTCYLCGKGIKNIEKAKAVEVVDETLIVVAGETTGADQADPFYRGCYPVGADCMARVRCAAREAGIVPTI